jgi:light-regulated signal transduction histidine kinase (bacteriophytochrome)
VAPFETVRRHKNGHLIHVSVSFSPVRDGDGKVIGVSKIARDITELKRTQRELVRAKEVAEASNRELEAFSYSVAHDLRSPLRSLDGFSQALLEDYADRLDETGRKYLDRIRASAQLMAQLIDDILTLARITRAELRPERVDLSALAWRTRATLEQSEPNRRVVFDIDEGLAARGDPRLLAVVIENLLGNAWKFSAKKEASRIHFGASDEAAETRYFVRDNGAGFDMAYAAKLFGLFQRLHSRSEFDGTGVGLATVQRIIQRHGGRIWADAAPGAGAVFYFTLPSERSS